MKNCTYKLTTDKETLFFDSEYKLNEYLAKNISSYITENGDIAFSLTDDSVVQAYLNSNITSAQRSVLEKLQPIAYKDDFKNTIGVTKLLKQYNRGKSEYDFINRIHTIYKHSPKESISDVSKILIQEMSSKYIGSIVHSIYENAGKAVSDLSKMSGYEINENNLGAFKKGLIEASSRYVESINLDIQSKGISDKGKLLDIQSEEDAEYINKVNDTITEVNNNLHNPIVITKEEINDLVDSACKDILNFLTTEGHINAQGKLTSLLFFEQTVTSDTLKDKSGHKITGIFDLMLIDENGKVTIADYKTSKKDFKSWSFGKENDTYFQQALYSKIVKEVGISDVKSVILPIGYTANIDSNHSVNEIKLNEVAKGVRQVVNINDLATDSQAQTDALIEQFHTDNFKNVINPHLTELKENFIDKYFIEFRNKEKRIKDNAEYYLTTFGQENSDGTWTFTYLLDEKEQEKTLSLPEALDFIAKNITNKKGEFLKVRNKMVAKYVKDFKSGKLPLAKLESLATSEQNSGAFTKHLLNKYINTTQYDLLDIPDLAEQGVLVFRDKLSNPRSPLIEVVTLTDAAVNTKQHLSGGDTLLGNARTRLWFKKDRGTILTSTNGNIEALVTLHLLSNKESLFGKDSTFKLGKMMVANIMSSEYSTIPLTPLLKNYKSLRRDIDNNIYEDIPEEVNVKIRSSQELLCQVLGYFSDARIADFKIPGFAKKSLKKKIAEIREDLPDKTDLESLKALILELKNDVTDLQYQTKLMDNEISDILADAEMEYVDLAYGIEDQSTDAIGSLLTFKNGGFESLSFNSPASIQDPHINAIHKILQNAQTNIRKDFSEFSFKHNVDNINLLRECGYNPTEEKVIGNETKYFDKIVRKNADGTIDSKFRIMYLDDIGEKSYRDLAYYYLEKFFIRNQKYNNPYYIYSTSEKLRFQELLKDRNSFVYNIPLMRKETGKLSGTRDFVKGFIRDGIDFFKDTYEVLKNGANNQLNKESEEYQKRANKRNIETVYNAFKDFGLKPNERTKYLATKGTDYFETNLNRVLLAEEFASIKEEEFSKVLPDIYMIKDVLMISTLSKNMDATELYNYVDNMLNLTVFNASKYKSKSERTFSKVLNAIKSTSSRVLFMFNPLSVSRDVFDGVWKGFIETAVKAGYQPLGLDYFMSALKLMSSDFSKETVQKVSLLNASCGITNMDLTQIVDRLQSEQNGAQVIWTKWAMSSLTMGDYGNRMTFLIAHMMQDGIWDSISFDTETGKLNYDIKKDKRFSLLFQEGVDQKSPEYLKQKSLLRSLLEQKNKESNGVLLLDKVLLGIQQVDFPYSNAQINNVKNQADLMYGFFDRSEKSQIMGSFTGSILLQFSTYLSSSFAKYLQPSGISKTQGKFVHQTDEEGHKLYKKYASEDSDIYEITTEAKGNEPLLVWEGEYMEGILASIWGIITDAQQNGLMNALRNIQDENNSVVRANLKRLIRDIISTYVLASLIKWLYNTSVSGNEDIPYLAKIPLYILSYGATNSANDMFFVRDIGNRLGFSDVNFHSGGLMPAANPIMQMAKAPFRLLTEDEPDFGRCMNSYINATKVFTRPDNKLY